MYFFATSDNTSIQPSGTKMAAVARPGYSVDIREAWPDIVAWRVYCLLHDVRDGRSQNQFFSAVVGSFMFLFCPCVRTCVPNTVNKTYLKN